MNGAFPGMDYRRSEISKRDLECQQGAEARLEKLQLFFFPGENDDGEGTSKDGKDGSFQALALSRSLDARRQTPGTLGKLLSAGDDLCMRRAKLFC